MIVVSDTSPLRYFISSGQADLIVQILGPLIVPGPVLLELTHPSAPAKVRDWCAILPDWISVRESGPVAADLMASVDRGEAAAIQLAIEVRADLLLIDERIGRREATRRAIPVVGTLGVLEEGFRRGLIADPLATIAIMRIDGFRISRRLLDDFTRSIESMRRQ